jgi:uncharacterized protein
MKKWTQAVFAAIILAVLVSGSLIVTYYTDWLWFKDVGYSAIFIKILITKVILFFSGAAVFFTIFYLNVLLTRRLRPKFGVSFIEGVLKIKTPVIERLVGRVLLAIAVLFSLIAGSSASGYWEETLKFLNSVSFGTVDPVFGYDISFFVFRLPMYKFLWGFFFAALVLSAIIAMAVHVIDGAIKVTPFPAANGEDRFAPHVKAHISSIAAALSVMLAIGFRLLQLNLLFSSRGVAYGASYTDVHAELPVFGVLAVVSLITAVLFIVNIKVKGWRLPLIAAAFLGGALILVGGIYPAIVQQYRVGPNEIALEKPYIKRNIQFTRKAYGLDKVDSQLYQTNKDITSQTLTSDTGTVDNIRLWDWKPLLKTYDQLQSFRPYYDFFDVDVDRYSLNGKYTQVALAAREMNSDKLPDAAKTWVNQHLVYTHGFGAVMSPVNKVTSEGLPELMVKDIPPVSTVLNIDKPQLYFGEETNDYVIVGTKTNEFDYPKGDSNQYTKFSGSSGVSIGGLFNRLMFAARFQSLQLFVSTTLTKDSKVLLNRNISQRVSNIAPFLKYDKDPYLVIAPDKTGKSRLYWIYDAYTTTDMYPYSQPFAADGSNYIKNSVKVVIDAYDGTTSYYLIDKSDPVASAYARMFPGMFKPGSSMPAALRKHLRYPEDLFSVQSAMYATYHMQDPQVFYNKEDLWQSANETIEGGTQAMSPYYMIMRLPGESTTDFRLIAPFTPVTKNNMVAWLSANCDGADYGRLIVYKFSKDKLIFGPLQIEARINQDPTISQFLTLVSQRGSTVSRGPLLVIPMGGSLIYVQPLYIQAEQGQLPELKRVFVSYGDQVVMEADLGTALQKLFGAPVAAETGPAATQPATQPTVSGTTADLINQAVDHYNKAMAAQKAGDWATYGTEIQAAGDILNKLKGGQ